MTLPIYTGEVPYLTTEQMVEVDRAMMEDFKIELIQMMENAGRNLAIWPESGSFMVTHAVKRLSSWRARVAMVAGRWSAPAVCTTTVQRSASW